MMWRALDMVGQYSAPAEDEQMTGDELTSWQDITTERLSPENRWVVAGPHQTLWPYTAEGDGTETDEVVVYPDIFGDDDDDDPALARTRKDALESCLPLLRIMGARTTSNLHVGVTHTLCNLSGNREDALVATKATAGSFVDPVRGERLLKKLRDIWPIGKSATLVSPAWIRKRKWRDVVHEEDNGGNGKRPAVPTRKDEDGTIASSAVAAANGETLAVAAPSSYYCLPTKPTVDPFRGFGSTERVPFVVYMVCLTASTF